ncbi:ion channel [Massilia sp. B-10]|nr:ion channel [Massilia sp. B-10]
MFILIQTLQPGTFAAAVNADSARTWTELNYLSFALLSSTGIGDVIPLTSHARAVASVEMFTGLIYLAGVVARLIGLTMQGRSKSNAAGTQAALRFNGKRSGQAKPRRTLKIK